MISKDLHQLALGNVTGHLFPAPTEPGLLETAYKGDYIAWDKANHIFILAARAHEKDKSELRVKYAKIKAIFALVIPIGVEDMLLVEESIWKLRNMLEFVQRYLSIGNKIGKGISFQKRQKLKHKRALLLMEDRN